MYAKHTTLILILLKEFVLSLGHTPSLNESNEGSSKILSRRKRYLIFPDGSSFQLVICTQTHGYLQVGDIVWFGNTAALAWELPTDPTLFHYIKENERDFAQNRNGVSKLIYFLDENGKVLSKVPYKRKPIVNPAFAKRSIEQKSNDTIKILHEKQRHLRHFKHHDKSSIEFHREGRKSFYTQLEKFIKAINISLNEVEKEFLVEKAKVGWNGRECVLRMLCEVGKGGAEQGMFLEEIVRVIFTLPSGSFESEPHKQYDSAHRTPEDCEKLYPHCKEFNSIN